MILFIKTSQGYSGGYKFGINAKLIDEHGELLAQIKGGGFDMSGHLFRDYIRQNYAERLTAAGCHMHDGMGVHDLNKMMQPIGVYIREVRSPVPSLYVYEVQDDHQYAPQ